MQAKQKKKTKPRSKAVIVADEPQFDLRRIKCWDIYVDPKSATFGNAKQSALAAGYSEGHANLITTERWFKEKVLRIRMSSKAERNLDEFLDLPSKTQAMGAFGPLFETKAEKRKGKDGKVKTVQVPLLNKKGKRIPIMTYNIGLIGQKSEVSKFVVERLERGAWGKKEEGGGNRVLIINISGQSVQRYGAHAIAG